MTSPSRALICVTSSVAQQADFGRIAEQFGLRQMACQNETATSEALARTSSAALLIVGYPLEDGSAFQLIENVRMSPAHAMLPIAFIMADRDLAVARKAMQAGATEVFLSREHDALSLFIDTCMQEQGAMLSGKALLVEDSDAEASYVIALCKDLGLAVDRTKSVDAAIAMAERNDYVLYLVDVVLEDTRSGIAFVKHLRDTRDAKVPILVMSGFADGARRLLALKSGADDFISKPFSPEEFVWRVCKLLQDNAVRPPETKSVPAGGLSQSLALASLSPREHEICMAILAGTSDKEIAQNLGISYWTVRTHIQQIFTKTGVLNRRELMSMFIPNQTG